LAATDDPDDIEGQLTDEDNVIRAAARREAKAGARHAVLTPLIIRAIREACGLSQQEAARVFGGGPKAFEKYESGEVSPSSSMTRLLLLAAGDVPEGHRGADDLRGRCGVDPGDGAQELGRSDLGADL
jgi:DNA-binding transcriptional regulator YiaG